MVMMVVMCRDLEPTDDPGTSQTTTLQTQLRTASPSGLQREIAYEEALVAEREEEFREIQSSVLEINEIFRDIGALVEQQQCNLGKST